jgi:hypothetical protein
MRCSMFSHSIRTPVRVKRATVLSPGSPAIIHSFSDEISFAYMGHRRRTKCMKHAHLKVPISHTVPRRTHLHIPQRHVPGSNRVGGTSKHHTIGTRSRHCGRKKLTIAQHPQHHPTKEHTHSGSNNAPSDVSSSSSQDKTPK